MWIDGEPHAVDAASRSTGCAGSVTCASPRRPTRARRENYLVIASDYEQPFGTFTGALPVAGRAARLGRDGAPRGALVNEILALVALVAALAAAVARDRRRARGGRGARRGGRADRRRRARRGTTRATRRGDRRPRSSCSPRCSCWATGASGPGCSTRWRRGWPPARAAPGRGCSHCVFAAAAAVTAVLGLDATVVLLTPAAFAAAAKARLAGRPHVYACTHLANSGSLLLPVSNLTNLLAFRATRPVVRALRRSYGAAVGGAVAVEWVVLPARVRGRAEAPGGRRRPTRPAAAAARRWSCSRSRSPGSSPPGRSDVDAAWPAADRRAADASPRGVPGGRRAAARRSCSA